jgi:GH25 family lysozyme M1 (1,4-beta-N-acetylmuramidase)
MRKSLMPSKEVHITDGSHWRWPTPLQALIDHGEQGFITKATEGTTWTDDYYDDWQIEADELDFPFGSFHYWRAAYDAQVQAKHYHDVATAWQKPLYPPILDMEKKNNVGVLTPRAASAHFQILVMETEQLWGEKPWIYCSYYSVKDLLGNPSWLQNYPLWVASYRNDRPSIPVPWQTTATPQYHLWQYTSTNPIPGTAFSGYDGNWWWGDQVSYTNWVASRKPATPPPPQPAFPFAGKVVAPTNINAFDEPMGVKVGLLVNEMGVYVREVVRDAEQIAWYKLGSGSYVKAKYIKALK